MDPRCEELDRELSLLHGGYGAHREETRRILGWHKKTFGFHEGHLFRLGQLRRRRTKRGVLLEPLEDGKSLRDRREAIAVKKMRTIERHAKSLDRPLTDEELLAALDWLAFPLGPLETGGRGRPRNLPSIGRRSWDMRETSLEEVLAETKATRERLLRRRD